MLQTFAGGIDEQMRAPGSRSRFQVNDRADRVIARAAANIIEWRSYLPEDCVSAMINAGWQWST
jgi:hypothetical protein